MAVIPLLIFFYILVEKLFTINILVGYVGLLFAMAILFVSIGYVLGYDVIKELVYFAERGMNRERVRSTLIAKVTHDLKNPVFALMGNIDNILSGIHGDVNENQKRTLEVCQGMTSRMNFLINNMLDIHRIEEGMVEFKRSKCDLLGILEGQLKEYEVLFRDKNLHLKKNIYGEEFIVWADERKIMQLINNLLSNAVKYSPENNDITVDLTPANDVVRLEILNSGNYIPEGELESIFDKYNRVDQSTEGMGLGLAIVKDIVELHRGKIWAESHPEKGNKFVVELPYDLREISRREEDLNKGKGG